MSKDLFMWETHIDQRRLRADTMVVTLGSFIDAGHAQKIMDQHLLNSLSSHVVGRFDVDQLVDYTQHRPDIVFTGTAFEDYAPPRMLLHEVTDDAGTPFLLLTGPEPSLRWEEVTEHIARIVEATGVRRTLVAYPIPMPVPHTRPVFVSRHAADPALVDNEAPIFGRMELQAAYVAMLQLRLHERGHDVIGLTAHVPQYLAQSEFPDSALALIKSVAQTSGLNLPTSALAAAADVNRAQISLEVQQNEELAQVVEVLEHQYDEFMNRRAITEAVENLPTADEIGAEAEEFLRSLGEETNTQGHDDSAAGPEDGTDDGQNTLPGA